MSESRHNKTIPKHVAWIRVILSLILTLTGIGMLSSPNFVFPNGVDDGIQKIAAGWIGAVLTFWFTD